MTYHTLDGYRYLYGEYVKKFLDEYTRQLIKKATRYCRIERR